MFRDQPMTGEQLMHFGKNFGQLSIHPFSPNDKKNPALILFKNNYKTGTCSYMFLILYGIFRIFSEFFREPDVQIGYLFNLISMGTMLSFFMILAGIIIFLKRR